MAIGIHSAEDWQSVATSIAAIRTHTPGNDAELVVLPAQLDNADLARVRSCGVAVVGRSGQGSDTVTVLAILRAAIDAPIYILLEAGSCPAPGWLETLLEALASDGRHGLAGPSTNFAWNEQCAFAGGDSTAADIARIARAASIRFARRWRTLQPGRSLSEFCLALRREAVDAIEHADDLHPLVSGRMPTFSSRAARAGFLSVWACSSYVWRSPAKARKQRDQLTASRTLLGLAAGSAVRPWCVRGAPLVSCIMITGNRRDFALQAVRYFQRQDYAAKELIIVDDGGDGLSAELPNDERIRYVRIQAGRSIGAKRNRACELARGSIIAQWDDDDWYSSNRLSTQVAPLVAGEADISGLQAQVFFDLSRWQFWQCSPVLHRRIFIEDVLGGSLVYRRQCWSHLAHYPDSSLAEDATFLRCAIGRGARLKRIAEPGQLIYVRHEANTWQFECGAFVSPTDWVPVPEPTALQNDRHFYAARAAGRRPLPAESPMVSCIMPTADRRPFVPSAVRFFLRQTYPNRELLIVDDGADSVADVIPDSQLIRYLRLESRQSVGAKRNLACELARGQLIAHWDDDDWMADWRLAYQVEALRRHGLPAACGLSRLYFNDPDMGLSWLYQHGANQRNWIAGGTLMYHKSIWSPRPFPDSSDGEDTRFVAGLPPQAIVELEDNSFYVARIHSGNTSRKRTSSPGWQLWHGGEIRALIASMDAIEVT